jgi:phthalate 4,5-dioxygenase oxygenase subunit
MLFDIYHAQNGTPVDEAALRKSLCAVKGVDLDDDYYRIAKRENKWLQDRAAMKNDSWTGVAGFQNQDIMAQESMGPIVPRQYEHLGTSDIAIIRMRKRVLENVRRFQAGRPLIGLDQHVPYDRLASEQRLLPIDEPWQAVGAHAGEHAPA